MFSRANLPFDEVTIYYHPETNKHLGIARIILRASKYMRTCVEKFDKKSVMGKVIQVFHDPYGEECRKAVEDMTTEKKNEPPPIVLPVFPTIPEIPKLPSDFVNVEFPPKPADLPVDEHWNSTSGKYRDKEYEWDYSNSQGRKYDEEYRSSKYYDKYGSAGSEGRKDRERDRERSDRGRDRDKYYHQSSSREDYDRSDRHKRDREKDRRRDYKDSYRDRASGDRSRKDREYYEYKDKDRYGYSSSKYNKDYDYFNSSYQQPSFSSSSNSWQPPPPVAPEESPPRPPPEPPNDEENDDKLNLKSDDAETTVDLDTRIAMLFNSKPFNADIPYGNDDKKVGELDGESSQNNEFDLKKLKIEDDDAIEEGEIKKSLSVSDVSTIGSVPSPFESCETYKSYLKVQKSRKRRRQARGKHKVESASDISSSEDELLAKGSYSPPLPSVKKEDDQMSLSSLSSTEPVRDEFDIKTFGSYMYPVAFSTYQSAYYNDYHNFQQPNKRKETNDPHEVAVKKVIEKLTYELKQILKKDFNKRMIENTAFKKYEAWWDDQERNKNTRTLITETTLTSPTKPAIESKVEIPSVVAPANFDYQQQGGSLGILRNLRFQRIKREPAKISVDDSRKSDDEDVVQGSDDEKEDIHLTSKTSYIKRAVTASISSESSDSSDESSDDEEEDEEDRDEHAYSSDTASLISDDDLAVKKNSIKKEKENNRIYSDTESEIDEKPEISKVKTSVSKIYSDSDDDDEGEPAPPGVDPEELVKEEVKIEPKIEPVKKPEISQPATESESDFNEDNPPRTPGRTSSDDKEVIKKKVEEFNDRMYSDSEEEREYQERIRKNTEWMEQIEREAKEKELEKQRQMKDQPVKEKPKELSPIKDYMKDLKTPEKLKSFDTKLTKMTSIDEPFTPTTSLPPPTPGANMDKHNDPMNNFSQDTSKKKRGRPKGSIGKPKEPKESKKVKNGAFAQPVQQQQNIPLQKYSLKLSPYSSDGGSSHASLVAQEHCYSLPPSASPSLSSSPHDIHMDHDYCGPTKNEVQPLQSIQPAQLDEHHKKEGPRPVGRPRKDPNAPKAQYNKKDKQGHHQPQPAPVKSPQKEKYKKVELKHHQKLVEDFVPVQRFKPRLPNEEFEVICRFFTEGVDHEDIDYMKRAYTYLIQNEIPGTENVHEKLHEVHWVDHCSTDRSFEPPAKKRRKDELPDLKEHKTGCARTEGYYKIDSRDKARYKYHHARSGNNDHAANLAVQKMQSASREARSNQRRLLTAFGATESDLLKFNQLKFRKKHLKFAKSAIHDWGLFAMEPIAADEMVIEYVGQMVRINFIFCDLNIYQLIIF